MERILTAEKEKTDFADMGLLEIANYLDSLIDRFEYSQLPETQMFYLQIRHDLRDITCMLRDLNEKIKKSSYLEAGKGRDE